MNYPLIKRCFPNLEINDQLMKAWFPVIKAEDLERELETAVKVTGLRSENEGRMKWVFGERTSPMDTHTALLIGIEPIKKETAEDLLRELIEDVYDKKNRYSLSVRESDIVERAKALLERGEK